MLNGKLNSKKFILELMVALVAYFFLSFVYLAPGSVYLLEKRTDIALSDGTDQKAAPFSYNLLLESIKSHPIEFFYGATYSDKVNPPQGAVLWFSWLEKFCVVVFSFLLPVEQIGPGIALFSITLSALSMFVLGKYLNWNRWLSFGLGISWGYSAFTLARSKVHPALDAVYFIPLLFLAFTIIRNDKRWVSIFFAAFLLLLIAIIPHYYIITTCFLFPFWIYYVLRDSDNKLSLLKKSLIVVTPSFLLLLWSLMLPIGPSAENKVIDIYPKTGKSETGAHPFLSLFAADPIDYLSGNIGSSNQDLNPLKSEINRSIYQDIISKHTNTHEHALGIRWLIILLGFMPLLMMAVKKSFFTLDQKKHFYFFYILAAFTFLMSLSPLVLGFNIGPSLWIYKLVSQIRVPNRAGIFVHFSLLMIVGLFLNQLSDMFKNTKLNIKLISILFPVLIILEMPPLNSPPTADINPSNKALNNIQNCGIGMYFPYNNAGYNILDYYRFLQMMRNSNCKILNSISWQEPRDNLLLNNFAKYPIAMNAIMHNDPKLEMRLVEFTKCMPLEWIFFDDDVPIVWRQKVCSKLGWEMRNDVTCVDKSIRNKEFKSPEACLSN